MNLRLPAHTLLIRRVTIGLLAISCLVFLVFLYWHFHLGMNRYFDVDEFAHLHWANQWRMGQRPYIDFLTFFPPGFFVFLAPLFAIGGNTVPLLMGRFLMFLLFGGMCALSAILFWQRRGSWVAIMAPLLLSFLPLPFDKYLEIRPDALATVLMMSGIVFQIRFMRSWKRNDGILTGFFYSWSLLVLTKGIPAIGAAILVLLCALFSRNHIALKKVHLREFKPQLLPLFIGIGIPVFLFGLWALTLGNLSTVLYSLTALPLEANKISKYFIMMPDLFFYPNEIYYGLGGNSQPFVVNQIVWLVGIFFGTYRAFTPFLTDRKHVWEEVLVSVMFFTHVILYVLFIPLKHAQYLIPIGIFIAWYAADGLYFLWEKVRSTLYPLIAFSVVFVALLFFLWQSFFLSVTPKSKWTNTAELSRLTELYTTIGKDEYIFDLDGRTFYFQDPYYACCIPFGQFQSFLSRPLPSLSDALERTQTKFIFQGELHRTNTLAPVDQAYISTHYEPWNGKTDILIRKQ